MMEDLPQRDELERKLRAEARDFEMEPSGLVWENIHHEIRRSNSINRPLVVSLSFLLVAGLAGGLFFRAHHASLKAPASNLGPQLSSRTAPVRKGSPELQNLSRTGTYGSVSPGIPSGHPSSRQLTVHQVSKGSFATLRTETELPAPGDRQPGLQDFSPLPAMAQLFSTGLP
ncbi:MAG TPA: hypothetical protein VMV20_03355, partial [Chitinophagaceae bacterium]|nr:hypothetical protein [Chitinophagaceae bacterium]